MGQGRTYIDSSVVLLRLLRQPGPLLPATGSLIASELMEAEVRRRLHRLHAESALSTDHLSVLLRALRMLLRMVQQIPISRAVLHRAGGPFPAPLKTLDAIHISTALIWAESSGEEVTFLTYDRQLAAAAVACSLSVPSWPPLVR